MSIDDELEIIFPRNHTVQGEEMVNGVSVKMTKYFGLDVFKLKDEEKKQLKDIQAWTKDVKDPIQEVNNINTRLGRPPLRVTHLDNVWNHYRIKTHGRRSSR